MRGFAPHPSFCHSASLSPTFVIGDLAGIQCLVFIFIPVPAAWLRPGPGNFILGRGLSDALRLHSLRSGRTGGGTDEWE